MKGHSPIVTCLTGHVLQPEVATGGICNRCGRMVRAGERVKACRPCKWLLCSTCHPQDKKRNLALCPTSEPRCRAGHLLKPQVARGGFCDGCGKRISALERVLYCQPCDHLLCNICHPQNNVHGHIKDPLWDVFASVADNMAEDLLEIENRIKKAGNDFESFVSHVNCFKPPQADMKELQIDMKEQVGKKGKGNNATSRHERAGCKEKKGQQRA